MKHSRDASASPPPPSKRGPAATTATIHSTAALAQLPILPPKDYERAAVPLQRPVEIACFGYDEERTFALGDGQMRYYHPPSLDDHELCQLSAGYPERYVERDESVAEHLDSLLRAILDIRDRAAKEDAVHHGTDVDFITWRGIMTKIFCTPYSRGQNDGWKFRVQRVDGCLFLEEPSQQGAEEQNLSNNDSQPQTDLQRKMCYWGYRLEAISTLDRHPDRIPDLQQVAQDRRHAHVNTNVQYCTVVKTRLGRNSMILGAEVDCSRGDKVPNDACRNYVELKTNKVLLTERDRVTFERYKLLKIYAQSFLVSVPTVVVGFRDKDGNLKQLQELQTLQIPRMVRARGYWDPNVCLNFADTFLTWLKQSVPAPQKDATTYLSKTENGVILYQTGSEKKNFNEASTKISATIQTVMSSQSHTTVAVEKEVEILVEHIQRLGTLQDGQYRVKYGVLFKDDQVANTLEALMGTLRAAKKRKRVHYDGELLLQGVHDGVEVIVVLP